MKSPAITVLMPVYNAEPYLGEAIESVLNQTFTDFEFLIINDGSTDKSEEIIFSYNDSRIRYVKNEGNLKLIATLNKGFILAKGEYLVRADADDVNYLDRLELQYRFMEQNSEVGLSGTGFETFGDNVSSKTVIYSSDHNTICLKHLYQIHLSHGTSIFRMSVIKKHQLFFDSSYEHAEDYELWTRISIVSKLGNLPQVLYKVRQHDRKVSKLYSEIQQQNSLRVKHGQFKKMGVELLPQEIVLFESIAHYKYLISKKFVASAKILLEKLVIANDKTDFLEKDFFKKSIAQFWFNVTYNCTSLGLFSFIEFSGSTLKGGKPLTLAEKIKFPVKAFLKK